MRVAGVLWTMDGREHLSLSTPLQSRDRMLTKSNEVNYKYIFIKPRNLPRQLPGLPAGLRRPCFKDISVQSFACLLLKI